MAVQAKDNVAELELKVKENEETINKLIIENHAKALTEINEKHVKVIGDITRLHAKVDGVSYVTQDDHVEALSETLRAVEAYKNTHEERNTKINNLKCRFDIETEKTSHDAENIMEVIKEEVNNKYKEDMKEKIEEMMKDKEDMKDMINITLATHVRQPAKGDAGRGQERMREVRQEH